MVAILCLCFTMVVFADQQATPVPGYDAHTSLKINRDYYDMAAATGGDFYFWAPGEFATANLKIPMSRENILLSYGRLHQDTQSFSFPVDTGVATLSVFVGSQRKDLVNILRPDGQSIISSEADVELQSFQHMTIATIKQPAVGDWRVVVTGEGHYVVTARLSMDRLHRNRISLLGYDFVELRGRPAHEGYFPIKDEVQAGQQRLCRIKYSGAFKTIQFEFVDRSGKILNPIEPKLGVAGMGNDESLAKCTVPQQSFRLQMRGIDNNGQAFIRMDSGLRLVPYIDSGNPPKIR